MSEETKVTRKDLHEKLWESRSFEINHLWQRSIFLATFIVALFTLYFSVLNLYYTELNSPKAHAEQSLEAKNENDSSIPENGKQESSEDEQKTKYNAAIFFVLETICFPTTGTLAFVSYAAFAGNTIINAKNTAVKTFFIIPP